LFTLWDCLSSATFTDKEAKERLQLSRTESMSFFPRKFFPPWIRMMPMRRRRKNKKRKKKRRIAASS
jgi:hypothetical protein